MPPAFSIDFIAFLLAACAEIFIGLESSHDASIFTFSVDFCVYPVSLRMFKVISLFHASAIFCRSHKFTGVKYFFLEKVPPRSFGSLKWSGDCPHSNKGCIFLPVRAFCHLQPRPQKTPLPEPDHRPSRLLLILEEARGLRVEWFNIKTKLKYRITKICKASELP